MNAPAHARASAPLEVRLLESGAELASLKARWETLQEIAAMSSVFESFDWQHLWWQSYGKNQPLRLLVATAGDELLGVLPLYVQSVRMLRFPVRLLRFVGSGGDTFPDDLGPVLGRGREGEVAEALAGAVLRLSGWDVLLLEDMNPACPFTAAIAVAVRAAGLHTMSGRSQRIAYLELPATWEAWLGSLHRDRRYRIKNIRKKLHAAHPARFFVWDDPATLDAGIDRLVHLHHKRWKSVGQAHAFNSSEYLGFHRAVMKACLERDRLRLYCLELAGDVAAMYYFYKFRDRIYLMQSGFDPDHSDVKPGQVLLGHIIEHAIAEGHKVLDFLRGDHRYKDELATGERETVHVTAYRPTPGGWVYRARRLYLPALKARLSEQYRRVRPAETKAE